MVGAAVERVTLQRNRSSWLIGGVGAVAAEGKRGERATSCRRLQVPTLRGADPHQPRIEFCGYFVLSRHEGHPQEPSQCDSAAVYVSQKHSNMATTGARVRTTRGGGTPTRRCSPPRRATVHTPPRLGGLRAFAQCAARSSAPSACHGLGLYRGKPKSTRVVSSLHSGLSQSQSRSLTRQCYSVIARGP